MPEISVDVGAGLSAYAIKADDTFWCKQGILQRNQLRDSEDEQMIADLAISVLQGTPFGFSGKALDDIYNSGSDSGKDLNTRLSAYGATRLKHEIVSTVSIIKGIVESVDPGPNALRRTVTPGSGNPIKTGFFAIFMACFDLCVRQRKSPNDNAKIIAALKSVQERLEVAAGQIRGESRQQNINTVKGLIQDFFEETEPPVLNHGFGTSINFENALRRSRIETASYECKQGLLRLDDQKKLDNQILDRIVETICAIANVGPNAAGALFIGVADKLQDKLRIESLYKIDTATIGARFCVGVDREAAQLGIKIDEYVRKIVSHVASSKLSEPLKTSVCSAVDTIVYRGHSVVCFWISPQKAASTVDDKLFIRMGSETKRVDGLSQTRAVLSIFER